MDFLLTQKDAARILGLSVRTLERHRLAGTGPRYARLGHLIRYRECDLAEWVRGSICTSTSHFDVSADGRASSKTLKWSKKC
jgi:predicted DNA-binding transcriptional regulator AlpA